MIIGHSLLGVMLYIIILRLIYEIQMRARVAQWVR